MRIDSFLEKLTECSVYALVAFYPVSKAMIEIAFTVAFLSWLAVKIMKREGFGWTGNFSAVSFLLFVIFSSLSVFVSPYPDESLRGIGKHLEEILFFLIVLDTFRTGEKLRTLIGISLAALLVTLGDALYQYGTGTDFLRGRSLSHVDTHVRLVGPFKEHSSFAAFMLAWASVALAFLFNPSGLGTRVKWLMGLILPLVLFCVFHTQARGGWMAFAAALIFFIIIQKKKVWLIFLGATMVAALVILPKSMIVHPDAERKEQSLVERAVLWNRALNVIRARPWLGTGINTYVKTYHQFDTEKSWRVQNYYAHNSYLQMAAERGLPALFFFLAFVLSFFMKGFRCLRTDGDANRKALLKGVMTALAGLLAFALVDTVFESLQTGMMIWLFFGIGFALLSFSSRGEKVRV